MSVSYNPKIVTDGLLVYLDAGNAKSYPGTGTAWTDLSGNANNGTLTNGPTFSSANGGSIAFDGVNDYCLVQHSSSLVPTAQITFETVVSFNSWNITGDLHILSKTEGGGYQISLNEATFFDGYLGAILHIAGAYRAVKVFRSTVSPGWHYVSVTFDGRYMKMYIDAVDVNTYDHGSTASITYSVNTHLIIAAEPSGTSGISGNYANCNVGSARVYNRALSAAEILQNFNATRGRYGI